MCRLVPNLVQHAEQKEPEASCLPQDDARLGPKRLWVLCAKLLVRYKDCLGNVGDTPQALLEPVLQYCSAANLATIDSETRYGARPHSASLTPQAGSALLTTAAGLAGAQTWTCLLIGSESSLRTLAKRTGGLRWPRGLLLCRAVSPSAISAVRR